MQLLLQGLLLPKGVATAYEKITDDVRVQIYPSVIKAGKGDVDIYAYAKDITENLTAYGGAGGLAAGTNVKAEAVTDAAARVEFINGTAADRAVISAVSADLFIEAKTNTGKCLCTDQIYGRWFKQYCNTGNKQDDHQCSGRSGILYTADSWKDLLIQAWIERIHAFAEAYSGDWLCYQYPVKANSRSKCSGNCKNNRHQSEASGRKPADYAGTDR